MRGWKAGMIGFPGASTGEKRGSAGAEVVERVASGRAPILSIVLPVLNEELFLPGTLRSIAEQDADPSSFEILVYDGGSVDQTMKIASAWSERFTHFSLKANPSCFPSSARNLGLADARGEVIAFVEGHCVLPRCFVRRTMELLDEHNADALGRPISLVVEGDRPVGLAIGIARESVVGHDWGSLLYSNFEGVSEATSCATVYRKRVFTALGRFDERLYVAEDVDFNRRFDNSGLCHYFSQELRCQYHPRQTFGAFLRQMIAYGQGRIRCARRHGTKVPLFAFAPLALAALLAALVIGFVLTGAWPSLAPCVLYLLLVAFVGVAEARKRGRSGLAPLVSIALITTHLGLAVGQVEGLVECRRGRAKRQHSS